MPYIKKHDRDHYDASIESILNIMDHKTAQDAAGDFTYVTYRLLKRFNGKFWMRALGIGCLVCAILEIYRRDHVAYEDSKIKDEGDVD